MAPPRAALLLLARLLHCAAAQSSFDVIVYGATPGGILAALAAADEGMSVLLINSYAHVGGIVTSGLGQTDKGNASVIGGQALTFFNLIAAAYSVGAPKFTFEPHVAEGVFLALLKNRSAKLTVLANNTLLSASVLATRITNVVTGPSADANAGAPPTSTTTFSASVFIDASYEGDLLAAAGVSFEFGREANTTYNESLGGRCAEPSKSGGHQFPRPLNYTDAAGKLLPMIYTGDPGVPGQADAKVQAFNFRMCLTNNASRYLPITQPVGYDPAYWELLRRYVTDLKPTSIDQFLNIGLMPRGSSDMNNNGPISTDFIGGSWGWPTGTPAVRTALYAQHKLYTQSFLYFLASDASVPAAVRKEAASWGLTKDEFVDNGNWPYQVYVREGRRMVGEFVFTQADREFNLRKPDSIGLFSYNIDTHHAQRIPQGAYVLNDGDVEALSAKGPGQMPYRMLLPKRTEVTNLLAPVPCSASHIGYGAIRLEPQFMILGQSAGVAAAHAIATGVAVQDVDVPTLQARLRALGQRLDL